MAKPVDSVSIPEAQQMLGVSRQRVYQLIRMGMLPSEKQGSRVWVPRSAIEQRLAGEQRLSSNQCVSSDEAAEFFGTDVRTVRDWITAGLLKGSKINNRICLSPQDVATFVPPTFGSSGRYPARKPTRTIRGRFYPPPPGWPTEDSDES